MTTVVRTNASRSEAEAAEVLRASIVARPLPLYTEEEKSYLLLASSAERRTIRYLQFLRRRQGSRFPLYSKIIRPKQDGSIEIEESWLPRFRRQGAD